MPFLRRFAPRPKPVEWGAASDTELAVAARIQNKPGKEAFVEIVRRHQTAVCAVAYGITGRIALTEDIAQETFLYAWKHMTVLREPAKLKAWLAKIARSTALAVLKREGRTDALGDEVVEIASPEAAPDKAAADSEDERLVWDALAELPENFRLPLALFYSDGQSITAVAAALELSEDAVKQRLSRGREALREKVAVRMAIYAESKLEGVMRRVQPSALLVVTIAAAIGLLAAPAVVAGAAFTAAAATSSVTTTTVATAMSTSKTSLTIAALVAAACLPLGYGARVGMESPPPVSAVKNPQSAAKTEHVGRKTDFTDSALFAEWRKLHDEHGSTADAMPALYKAISDIKDPVRRRVFRAAQIAEWAEISPDAGLAFFMQKGRDSGQRNQFFDEWLQRDAASAVGALMNSGAGWEDVARRSLTEIAKRAPGRVAEIAARLPKNDSYWGNEVRDAFAIIAAGGLAGARSAAEAMTGENREQALAGVAKAWAVTDPDAAIAWAKGLPEGVDRDEIIRGALIGLSTSRPASALDLVKSIPPGGRQGYFATTTGARVLSEAAKADYDATVAWLAAHPSHLGHEDMMGMASVVTDRLNADPAAFLKRHTDDGSLAALMPAIGSAILNQAGGQRAAIWQWLQTQPDSGVLRQLRREIINSAGYQDPDFAIKMVGDMPKTSEGDEFVRNIASSLLNGGQYLPRLEGLLASAPERLHQPLMEAAFLALSGDNFDDPQKWIGRLAETPEDKRANLTARMASAWAQQMPEEAVAWAATLPEGGERSAAMGSAASAWITLDAYRASEWISTLPAGSDKDAAATSLVHIIAKDSPAEAWQWALSITDPSARASTAFFTLGAMQKHDPAAARQWLEAAAFTPQEKEQIRTGLDNPGALVPGTLTPSTASPIAR